MAQGDITLTPLQQEYLADSTRVKAIPDIEKYLRVKLERGYLQDLETGELMTFLLNPEKFKETYKANYARLESPGLSHKRLHFTGCENADYPLTLYFDQLIYVERRGTRSGLLTNLAAEAQSVFNSSIPNDVEQWRRFAMSLVTPRRSDRLASASPSPVLFYWPGMVQTTVRVTEVSFEHSIFECSGKPRARAYTLEIKQEEDVPAGTRLYADDVRRHGTMRPWANRR